jgi:hypothetical protein
MSDPTSISQDRVRDLAVEKYGFVPEQIKVLNAHSPAAAKM